MRGGDHPLDSTAVHPERYALVEKMAADLGTDVGGLVQNEELLRKLEGGLSAYVSEDVGLPTLRDILDELRRPGRDPRDAFEAPAFRDDVTEPKDLKPGMVLEGVVTNVVAFGAFVDVGVHQDGLVHISQLADRFVKDPNEVVKVGQRVRVTVMSVDLERNRIGLSMKSAAAPEGAPGASKEGAGKGPKEGHGKTPPGKGRGGPRKGSGGSTPKKGTVAPNGMRFR